MKDQLEMIADAPRSAAKTEANYLRMLYNRAGTYVAAGRLMGVGGSCVSSNLKPGKCKMANELAAESAFVKHFGQPTEADWEGLKNPIDLPEDDGDDETVEGEASVEMSGNPVTVQCVVPEDFVEVFIAAATKWGVLTEVEQ